MTLIILAESESGERVSHILEDREQWAIKGALAANRPMLVRGEPGIGKTQLAWAAATMLNRPLVSMTLDSNTEARDLLWTFDAVQRLAEAQVASATTTDKEELREQIAVGKFVRPGPVWWTFDWESAKQQLRVGEESPVLPPPNKDGLNWTPKDGVVMLIDEIDKAESDVPNGLLEALGYRQFTPQGWDRPIKLPDDVQPPLIIITTNEERVLPDAFVRRCFVLQLALPDIKDAEGEFIDYLVRRGEAHFPEARHLSVTIKSASGDDERHKLTLPVAAATVLLSDRKLAIANQQSPLPGQAEYLDFLRAIMKLASQGEEPQEVFQKLQSFVFSKSSGTVR
jgi:MoxR-like ATPase